MKQRVKCVKNEEGKPGANLTCWVLGVVGHGIFNNQQLTNSKTTTIRLLFDSFGLLSALNKGNSKDCLII